MTIVTSICPSSVGVASSRPPRQSGSSTEILVAFGRSGQSRRRKTARSAIVAAEGEAERIVSGIARRLGTGSAPGKRGRPGRLRVGLGCRSRWRSGRHNLRPRFELDVDLDDRTGSQPSGALNAASPGTGLKASVAASQRVRDPVGRDSGRIRGPTQLEPEKAGPRRARRDARAPVGRPRSKGIVSTSVEVHRERVAAGSPSRNAVVAQVGEMSASKRLEERVVFALDHACAPSGPGRSRRRSSRRRARRGRR